MNSCDDSLSNIDYSAALNPQPHVDLINQNRSGVEDNIYEYHDYAKFGLTASSQPKLLTITSSDEKIKNFVLNNYYAKHPYKENWTASIKNWFQEVLGNKRVIKIQINKNSKPIYIKVNDLSDIISDSEETRGLINLKEFESQIKKTLLSDSSFLTIDKELITREKDIKALHKAGVSPLYFKSIFNTTKKSKCLDRLLFENHLLKQMNYFGHSPTFNDKGEMTFKFTERISLKGLSPKAQRKIKAKSIESLHNEWQRKRVYLEVRGNFNDGCYQTISPSDISVDQLKELIFVNGDFNGNVNVVYPTKHLTIEQLQENGVFDEDGDIESDFTYTNEGFIKKPSDWNHLTPIGHTNQPPEKFTLELLLHTKGTTPAIMKDGNWGHTSIKLTTPNGEIYSIGFYPSEDIAMLEGRGIGLQKGDLIYLDDAIFLPSHAYTHNQFSYTFPDDKKFHEFMRWIAAMKSGGEKRESNLFYHYTHHSCTTFAKAARDYALKLGAKAECWDSHKLSDWTKTTFKIKRDIFKFFANAILKSPIGKLVGWDKGIEYAGIKNLNIRQLSPGQMDLPIDLIFEHIDIYNSQLGQSS